MKISTALDYTRQNEQIQKSIKESIEQTFPIETNKRVLEIQDVRIEDTDPTNDYPAIKQLKLDRRSYVIPVYGTVVLKDKLTGEVIGAAIEVHKTLGPGLLESVYEKCLCKELELKRIPYENQKELPVEYKGSKLDCGFYLC